MCFHWQGTDGQVSYALLVGRLGLSEIIKQMKETAAGPNDLPHARDGCAATKYLLQDQSFPSSHNEPPPLKRENQVSWAQLSNNRRYVGTDIIYSQKIYGLYARKHHIVEMRGDVTDAGRPTDRTITEDRATQPMEAGG